jgi:porphobilinogen synthase
VFRHSLERLLPVAEQALTLGVPALALFPVIGNDLKTPGAEEAFNPEGLVPRVVRELKKRFPELGVITDIALDPYTSHGQDGLIDESGYVVNDETLVALEKQALAHAQAGVDIVAPSDMMDGRISHLRGSGWGRFIHVRILAYRPSTSSFVAPSGTRSARARAW